MTQTSLSLLERARDSTDEAGWSEFIAIYEPLMRRWLTGRIAAGDVADVIQDVLVIVIRRLPQFEHNRQVGAFRRWLKLTTINCLRDFYRANRMQGSGKTTVQLFLQEIEDPESEISQFWDREHDRYVADKIMQMIRPRFRPNTWEAFHRFVVEDKDAEQVASDLGMSVNSVYIAKSRVLAAFREEALGLLDQDMSL